MPTHRSRCLEDRFLTSAARNRQFCLDVIGSTATTAAAVSADTEAAEEEDAIDLADSVACGGANGSCVSVRNQKTARFHTAAAQKKFGLEDGGVGDGCGPISAASLERAISAARRFAVSTRGGQRRGKARATVTFDPAQRLQGRVEFPARSCVYIQQSLEADMSYDLAVATMAKKSHAVLCMPTADTYLSFKTHWDLVGWLREHECTRVMECVLAASERRLFCQLEFSTPTQQQDSHAWDMIGPEGRGMLSYFKSVAAELLRELPGWAQGGSQHTTLVAAAEATAAIDNLYAYGLRRYAAFAHCGIIWSDIYCADAGVLTMLVAELDARLRNYVRDTLGLQSVHTRVATAPYTASRITDDGGQVQHLSHDMLHLVDITLGFDDDGNGGGGGGQSPQRPQAPWVFAALPRNPARHRAAITRADLDAISNRLVSVTAARPKATDSPHHDTAIVTGAESLPICATHEQQQDATARAAAAAVDAAIVTVNLDG